MVPLETINQLKSQGKTEQEIIGTLQEQGNSPKDIVDALNQYKIKNAVNPVQNQEAGMSPSIMTSENEENSAPVPTPSQETYTPQPSNNQENYQQQYNQPQAYEPQNYSEQNYAPSDDYYPPQDSYDNYSQDQTYSPQDQNYEQYEGYVQPYESTDTIIEISEQVFSEKSKRLEAQIKEVLEFKRIYQERINEMNERIKRIEKYFDKMQIAIMDKVTMFGKNMENLQKEINMVEDSFSKVVNPLTDKHHKTSSHKK